MQHIARGDEIAREPRTRQHPCAGMGGEKPVANRLASRSKGDALDGRCAIHDAIARRIQMIAFQHLQAKADGVPRRSRHGQQPDEAFTAFDDCPHGQRLQATEIELALSIAGAAFLPQQPGLRYAPSLASVS